MSEPPIADYLARLRQRLRWHRRRDRVLAEVEDHLRAAARDLQEQGMTAEAATREAIAQLGSPDGIVPAARRDRIRLAAAVGLIAVVAIGAIAGVTRPWAGSANTATTGTGTNDGGPAAQSMAVFSETRTSRDILPTSVAASISQGLSHPVGIQPSLLPGRLRFKRSRVLVTSAAGSLYGVPTSSGHVCLTDSLQRGGCVDSFIHFPGSVSWGVGQPPGGGDPILDGAIPDDVTGITVNLGDGDSAQATIGRNGFIYQAPTRATAIDSLTIAYSSGRSQTITIGYPYSPGLGIPSAAAQRG